MYNKPKGYCNKWNGKFSQTRHRVLKSKLPTPLTLMWCGPDCRYLLLMWTFNRKAILLDIWCIPNLISSWNPTCRSFSIAPAAKGPSWPSLAASSWDLPCFAVSAHWNDPGVDKAIEVKKTDHIAEPTLGQRSRSLVLAKVPISFIGLSSWDFDRTLHQNAIAGLKSHPLLYCQCIDQLCCFVYFQPALRQVNLVKPEKPRIFLGHLYGFC